MKSKVYFVAVKDSNDARDVKEKIALLLEKSAVTGFIRKDQEVAVKMHFGEAGNTGFVRPEYARVILDDVVKRSARAFLSDTNTLYRGRRVNSKDHLKLAEEHGFSWATTGVEIVIPDDTRKEDVVEIPIAQKFIKSAKVARVFVDAGAIVIGRPR